MSSLSASLPLPLPPSLPLSLPLSLPPSLHWHTFIRLQQSSQHVDASRLPGSIVTYRAITHDYRQGHNITRASVASCVHQLHHVCINCVMCVSVASCVHQLCHVCISCVMCASVVSCMHQLRCLSTLMISRNVHFTVQHHSLPSRARIWCSCTLRESPSTATFTLPFTHRQPE